MENIYEMCHESPITGTGSCQSDFSHDTTLLPFRIDLWLFTNQTLDCIPRYRDFSPAKIGFFHITLSKTDGILCTGTLISVLEAAHLQD